MLGYMRGFLNETERLVGKASKLLVCWDEISIDSFIRKVENRFRTELLPAKRERDHPVSHGTFVHVYLSIFFSTIDFGGIC